MVTINWNQKKENDIPLNKATPGWYTDDSSEGENPSLYFVDHEGECVVFASNNACPVGCYHISRLAGMNVVPCEAPKSIKITM